ncbi:L,D-transpeptidase [Verrucomicrobiaceae bacterium R5-34]|uniref:L,D-transpeptidase n=1 Tax=Oceaniferula flava TaxID=2800421 RepID=A0AAE2VD72_9BACT|nr:L,D-transpeptidase [Oceaniferula flavus]MBK1830945.1 L,D-transpeptidase [Verrucomicrobiaceae bacterium R5-34]MBK1855791.1 L,D-transpeptidase [Oceaniferula flavus]MBM1137098.1 L,D-transpeptidase [Oceaniferula flavus]
MKLVTYILPALAISVFLSSCSDPSTPNPNQTKPLRAVHVNPYQPGSYKHFKAQKGYPRNYGVYKNEAVLARTNSSNASIRIDLSDQRGYLMNGTELAMDYPVATGRSDYPTPTGNFRIVERIKSDKRSTTYGKIYDAEGNLVKSNADSRKDKVPEGGKYVGAAMPYWMRLTWDGIGMHKGNVPRHPASHGCIRTYYKVVSTVFDKTRIGTRVSIVR